MSNNIQVCLTFDDVLLVPQYSDITSRQNVDTKTMISKHVPLNIPFVSSNMDTITEDKMAIAMAQLGGIGIIHRYCSIEEEVEMVRRVKRAESYIINNPYTAYETDTIGKVKGYINKYNVKTYLIIDQTRKLKGIITNRDMIFADDNDSIVDHMTPFNKLVYSHTTDNITFEKAKRIMHENKIEKLPIIDDDGNLVSLICSKDIERIQKHPNANLDSKGRLRCGAAIGVKSDSLQEDIFRHLG